MAVLVLIDGSSYLYRAFHALPPLTNSQGEPTGAIYGVVSMVRKLLKAYQPDYAAIVFDAIGQTFRDVLYDGYKAQRPSMPIELQKQIEPLYAIIQAMGIPLLTIAGVEADDVIGTLACQAVKQKLPTLISTNDKDFTQLVNEYITVVNPMTNTALDRQTVINQFKVSPELIIDYLTLVGDNVDNIPGVVGVGPKTAVKWLNAYGSLANLINHADQVNGKIGVNLRNAIAQFPLIQELVTIKKDVPVPVTPTDLVRKTADPLILLDWFKRLEFNRWFTEIKQSRQPDLASSKATKYSIIVSQENFQVWLNQLEHAELVALDIETNSLDYMSAEIVGISLAVATNQAAYIPLAHHYVNVPLQLNREQVLTQLKPFLENPKKKKLGHHLKYDTNILATHGITLQGIMHDTMLESYVLNSTGSRHNLDNLALNYLNYHTIRFEDVVGKGAKQLTFDQVNIEKASQYAAEDADITWQLHTTLWPKITQFAQLTQVYTQLEIPLITILAQIEQHGVLIDAALLLEQSADIAKRLTALQIKAYQLADEVFNLNSAKQLQAILYDKQGLPVLAKTPTGQASTSEAVLQELSYQFELPKIILEYRSLSKLKSTYTDRLPMAIHPRTNRIHTSYHQAAVATGRLSSTDPNLQNIPIRTEEGRRIRQAFIAPPGYKIVAADYSQIELRIMAHLSQDAGLLASFRQGLDIHKATAAEVFGILLEHVTREQRRHAKTINFGLIYGMSSFGLAKQLGIDRSAAQDYINRYFNRYPGVKNYMEKTRQMAHQLGYVETLAGRRLNLLDINNRNLQRQKAAERAAINAPLQGTAADIIKKAMILVDHAFKNTSLKASMIMQVHDELVFEIAEDDIAKATAIITDRMVHAADLKVPLAVDVGIGNNWDEAH